MTVFLGICLFIPMVSRAVFADTPVTVLVFPFTIHAADDQAFLKQAVMDMLVARLSGTDRTIVFAADSPADAAQTPTLAVSETAARDIGLDKNADYMLMGSLTLLGESVSTDARLIRVADQKHVATFNRVGRGHGAVIEHVDAFAAQINQDVFGAEKPDTAPVEPQKAPLPGTPLGAAEPSAALSYWKSENFKTEIHSLAIGDITGDGRNEVVFVDLSTVYVHRYAEGAFAPLLTLSEKTHNQFMRVDTADINGNGVAEIFVTNYVPNHKRLQSFVLEWNGTAFERISEKADWYYRVVHRPPSADVLLGQKRGAGSDMLSVKDALFEKEIYELKWQDGAYRPAIRQELPDSLILYGYAMGDVSNTGRENIVAFSDRRYLTLLNLKGEMEWESDAPYGGGTLFFEVTDPYDVDRTEKFYLPQRIHVTDFDKDGANEIIVVKNHDAARVLSRTKFYTEGLIESLAYDAIGVQLNWQTRKISGYISDYTIGDLDNDGRNELVFASVTKRKSSFNKGLSAVVVCTLGQ
jgi:TolB-like protein